MSTAIMERLEIFGGIIKTTCKHTITLQAELEEAKTQENGKVQSACKRWKLDLTKLKSCL